MKTVYLALEDSPSKTTLPRVDYLAEKGIPAAFFCIGKQIEGEREEIIRYAMRKGFLIGNHSYDHQQFSSLSLEQCTKQIAKTESVIEKIHLQEGIVREGRAFLFPCADSGVARGNQFYEGLQNILSERGFQVPKANITYAFWKDMGNDKAKDVRATFSAREWRVNRPENKPKVERGDFLKDLLDRINAPKDEFLGGSLTKEGSEEIWLMYDHDSTYPFFVPMIEEALKKGVEFRKMEF